MSIYRCNRCDETKDNDWVICHADPEDSTELICDECHDDFLEEQERQSWDNRFDDAVSASGGDL